MRSFLIFYAKIMFELIHAREILSVFLIIFSMIDIAGSIPVIIELERKSGGIKAFRATAVAGGLMMFFLFFGEGFLDLFGIDISSFALAGSIIVFIIAFELILGVEIFKPDLNNSSSDSIVPLAFPLIAGAGTLATIISLKAEYKHINIFIGVLLNLIIVFVVLKLIRRFGKWISPGFAAVLKRVFGIILLAIAIKLFKSNYGE